MPNDEVEEEGEEFQCPSCGAIVGPNEMRCRKCGAEFEADSFECPACHKEVTSDDTTCPHCGAIFEPEEGDVEENVETSKAGESGGDEIAEDARGDAGKEVGAASGKGEVIEKADVDEAGKAPAEVPSEVKATPSAKSVSVAELMEQMERDRMEFEAKISQKKELSAKELQERLKAPSKGITKKSKDGASESRSKATKKEAEVIEEEETDEEEIDEEETDEEEIDEEETDEEEIDEEETDEEEIDEEETDEEEIDEEETDEEETDEEETPQETRKVKVVKTITEEIISPDYSGSSKAWKAALMGGFVALMCMNIYAVIWMLTKGDNIEMMQTGILYFKYSFPLFFGIVAITGGAYIFIYGKGVKEHANSIMTMLFGLAFMLGTFIYFKKIVFIDSVAAMSYYREHEIITPALSTNQPDGGILIFSAIGFGIGVFIIIGLVYGLLRPALISQGRKEADSIESKSNDGEEYDEHDDRTMKTKPQRRRN